MKKHIKHKNTKNTETTKIYRTTITLTTKLQKSFTNRTSLLWHKLTRLRKPHWALWQTVLKLG